MSKQKLSEKDLVVLVFATNNCYTHLYSVDDVKSDKTDVNPPIISSEFSVDLERKVWSYGMWKNIPIGKSRNPSYPGDMGHTCNEGVIGVYNRQDIDHLNNIILESREAPSWGQCHAGDD